MKIMILAACLATPLSLSAVGTLLYDDFSGPSIDSSKWTTILPFASSSVNQSLGSLTTTGRGIMASAVDIQGPYSISGTFTTLHSEETFNVFFGSDLSSSAFGDPRGLLATFSNADDRILIQRYSSPSDYLVLDEKPYVINSGQTLSFEITYDGLNISLLVNGVTELSGSTGFSTGNRVGFYSRELPYTATSVDSFLVTTIPEPSSLSIIMAALFTSGFIGRTRKFFSMQ